MVDNASRAVAEVISPGTQTELENVEFIGQALKDPLNVLRIKMKELAELDDDSQIRRVIVITDYMTEEGRSLGIMFSEQEHETEDDASDSVLATLTRLKTSMALE